MNTSVDPVVTGQPATAAWGNEVSSDLQITGPTVPTLSNSWVAFGGSDEAPQYWLQSGRVYCQGVMKSGTTASTVFTFPAGMRPLATIIPPIQFSNNGGACIAVSSAGVVTVLAYITPGSNASVSLHFDFMAEQ